MTLEKRIEKLVANLRKEFDTHCVQIDGLFKQNTRMMIILIEYPLSFKILSLFFLIPKKEGKKLFDFIEQDAMNSIYSFINNAALRYDSKYGKQNRGN